MSSLGQGLEQIFGVSCSVSLYRQLTVAWVDHWLPDGGAAVSIHTQAGHSQRTAQQSYGASSDDFRFISRNMKLKSFQFSTKWQELLCIRGNHGPTEEMRGVIESV